MATPQKSISAQRSLRVSKRRDIRKPPRGVKEAVLQKIRRSTRIPQAQANEDRNIERVSSSPQEDKVLEQRASQGSEPLQSLSEPNRQPKRLREIEHPSPNQEGPPTKRPKPLSSHQPAKEDPQQQEATAGLTKDNIAAIETWTKTQRWPPEYFKPDSQVGKNFLEISILSDEEMKQSPTPVVQYVEMNGFRYPRPTPKIKSEVRQKKSSSSLTESSDDEIKKKVTSEYRDNRYPSLLAAKGSFMAESTLDISNTSESWCLRLMDSEQTVPENSLFQDNVFRRACGKLQDRNEARVVQDVARLIVPSAETLATYGAEHLGHLIENVNETWSECIPFEGSKPKPDYSVGFTRSSFTEEQYSKISPFIGTLWDTSFFAATYRMCFPFLTCESKCGAAAFEIADRQNAQSMTVAVRGVVELYRLVKREQELHREILAFSISHDSNLIKIFGHYAVIDGKKTTFFRHPIHAFSFQGLNGRDKWTAYKFTKNVYDLWMPMHLNRICSAIDLLPLGVTFEVSQSDLQFSDTSEMLRGLHGLQTDQSNVESTSYGVQDGSETIPGAPRTETPGTSDISPSQGKEKATSKRPKRKHTAK